MIGGTGSHHINARKSFYGTLTAYLIAKPETPAEKILEIMEKKLEPLSNSHKGVRSQLVIIFLSDLDLIKNLIYPYLTGKWRNFHRPNIDLRVINSLEDS